jgi:protein-tyrosine phosphatase
VIDLHAHILPGIDDGPADLLGSLAMAELAVAQGTRTIVATPHLRDDYPAVIPTEIADRVRELNDFLTRLEIELEVAPGAEVALNNALELSDAELRAATLGHNGRDLLIETPYGPLPAPFEQLLAAIAARGFRVTLAHPELNPSFQQQPERLGELVEAGTLMQVTARSLRASRRSSVRALADVGLVRGWIHVLASDAHAADWRPPDLGSAVTDAQRTFPSKTAELRWMVLDSPRAILAGVDLPPRPSC